MVRRLVTVALVAGALVAPATAWGGGFVTVGLGSLPDGTRAGQAWNVDVTVLGHGRSPLPELAPSVIVSRGSVTKAFRAAATDAPGVYRARVVFPSAGTWRVAADEGWEGGPAHDFGSFAIAGGDGAAPAVAAGEPREPAPVADDGPSMTTALVAALAAALLTAALAAALQRRRPPRAPRAAAAARG